MSMLWVQCPHPDCTMPAIVVERRHLRSTKGTVVHVVTSCPQKHFFFLPLDMVEVSDCDEPGG